MLFIKFRKYFKNISYPKKGTIIGLLIFLILYLFFIILIGIDSIWIPISGQNYTPNWLFISIHFFEIFVPGFILINLGYFVYSFTGGVVRGLVALIIIGSIVLVAYALVGAFSGWVYGKLKKKKYAKFLVAFFILFLYIVTTYWQYRLAYGPDYRTYSVDDCEIIKNEEDENWCYIRIAESGSNVSICEKIGDGYMQAICYRNVAKDISTCEKILDRPLYNDCYRNVAIYLKNISVCEMIQNDEKMATCIDAISSSQT